MAQSIYSSRYAEHLYDDSLQTLFSTWHPDTNQMNQEDFKHEMEEWLRVSQEVRPKFIYDYCKNFVYPINPDEQVWMAHLLNPGWIDAGVEKYSHIVPEEFITSLSVDQMFEEFFAMNLPNQFEIRHFSSEAEGQIWLFGKVVRYDERPDFA